MDFTIVTTHVQMVCHGKYVLNHVMDIHRADGSVVMS